MSQKHQVCIRKCLSWWVNYLSELPKFVAGGYALIYSSACPSIPIARLSVPMLANTAIKLFLRQLALLLVPQGGILYHYCVLFLNTYLGNVLKKTIWEILLLLPTDFFSGLLYSTGEPKSTLFFLIAFPQNREGCFLMVLSIALEGYNAQRSPPQTHDFPSALP